MSKKSGPTAPDPIDPGESMGEYLFGKGFDSYQGITDPLLQQKLIESESTYRPQYTELELADIATMARGTGDTPGLFGLLEESGQRAFAMQQDQLAQQRESDISALEDLSPRVVDAYRTADPYSSRIAEQASALSADTSGIDALRARGSEFLASTGQLSPLEQRRVQQASRAASAARGRVGDESAIYSEVRNRMAEELGKRDRDIALGSSLFGQADAMQSSRMGQAFGMNRAMAGDLGSTILGRPSQGLALGGQVLGQAQAGASGQMGPQLFDPNVGINMALQEQANQVGFAGAQAQHAAGIASGVGQAVGLAAAAKMSDVRLKENVKRIGTHDSGVGIYTYNYIGDAEFQVGVMAQEVQKNNPDAVIALDSGYLAVDYSKL